MAVGDFINVFTTATFTTSNDYVCWFPDTNYIHYKYTIINDESKREKKFRELKQRLMSESN